MAPPMERDLAAGVLAGVTLVGGMTGSASAVGVGVQTGEFSTNQNNVQVISPVSFDVTFEAYTGAAPLEAVILTVDTTGSIAARLLDTQVSLQLTGVNYNEGVSQTIGALSNTTSFDFDIGPGDLLTEDLIDGVVGVETFLSETLFRFSLSPSDPEFVSEDSTGSFQWSGDISLEYVASPVPLPGALPLLLVGAGALAGMRLLRRED